VLDGSEGLGHVPAHRLGRAIGGDELGVGLLELAELAQEAVVLGVRDLGAILDVIEIVVPVDGFAERLDPFRVLRHGGAQSITPPRDR
jgi:hypothetical protein